MELLSIHSTNPQNNSPQASLLLKEGLYAFSGMKPLAQNALAAPVDTIIPATDVFTPISQTRTIKPFFAHIERNHPVLHPSAREDHLVYHRTIINN